MWYIFSLNKFIFENWLAFRIDNNWKETKVWRVGWISFWFVHSALPCGYLISFEILFGFFAKLLCVCNSTLPWVYIFWVVFVSVSNIVLCFSFEYHLDQGALHHVFDQLHVTAQGIVLSSYFIFVTTITTAGCVKKSVKCKIFQWIRERNCFDIAQNV